MLVGTEDHSAASAVVRVLLLSVGCLLTGAELGFWHPDPPRVNCKTQAPKMFRDAHEVSTSIFRGSRSPRIMDIMALFSIRRSAVAGRPTNRDAIHLGYCKSVSMLLDTFVGDRAAVLVENKSSHYDIVMKYPDVEPGLKDEVPWSDSLTAYDKEHFTTYLRFLDASADNASYEEMAQVILGIDPVQEPERARKAARCHRTGS